MADRSSSGSHPSAVATSSKIEERSSNSHAEVDVEKVKTVEDHAPLRRATSSVSHHDIHGVTSHADSFVEVNAAQYQRFSPRRKIVITSILSLCGLLSPVSSTAILSAVPEVAATYDTSGSVINVSNALYLVAMAIAPCFWGPLSQVYGRRWICVWSAILFFAFSIGTALAPNLEAYFIFRILTAFQGTSFLLVGTSCIGDIYTPTERGTALSWFLSGALIGPCLAPLVGGAIVTYSSWREIFWMQTGLGGVAAVLVVFFLPETIPTKNIDELQDLPPRQRTTRILHLISPFRVIVMLFSYPNLIIVGLASSSLVFNMYSMLSPIRYVLNPRFDLNSPLQSGLFFIAPGCGYLLGTFFGGRLSDWFVKKYISKRNRRVSEDRLRTVLIPLGIVIPGCMLVYGWSVEKRVGGIPLPVIAMFLQGVAQLCCFPSLNTYCIDVMQSKGQGSVVVAGNYMIRYVFGAVGSAICLPAIQAIGVGWFTTISAVFMVASAGAIWTVTIWGEAWRKGVNANKARRKAQRHEKEASDNGGKEVV